MNICLSFSLGNCYYIKSRWWAPLPIPVFPSTTTHLLHFKEDLPTMKSTFSPCYLNLSMVPVLAGLPNTLQWPAFRPSRQRRPKVLLSHLPRDSSNCYYPPWRDSPGKSFYVFSHSSWALLLINTQQPQGSPGGVCCCQHSSAGLSLSCQSMGRKQFSPSLDRRNVPKSLICISSAGLIPASSR